MDQDFDKRILAWYIKQVTQHGLPGLSVQFGIITNPHQIELLGPQSKADKGLPGGWYR